MAIQYGHGQIVTTGLVLNLDAADRNSYPGSGTTWIDTSGYGNSGALVNGPTFNSGNGGGIQFDGTDDYLIGNKPVFSSVTLEYACKLTGNALYGYPHLVMGGNTFIGFVGNTSSASFRVSINPGSGFSEITSTSLNPSATFNIYTLTYNGVTAVIYVNGVRQSNTMNIAPTFSLMTETLYSLSYSPPSYDKAANIMATLKMYNRALSDSEVLQNYTVQRKRFGI